MPRETKNRIYSEFGPNIELDELSVPSDETNRKSQKFEDSASMEYPLIKINDHIFYKYEIKNVKIDATDFLPTISVTLVVTNKAFLTKDFPKDGDILSIMIRHKTDVLKPVRNDYIITGASTPKYPVEIEGAILNISGELFVPGLKSYFPDDMSWKGTSFQTLKKVAKVLELGFSTNEKETNDEQIWYVVDNMEDFIKDTTAKAWKDEESFFDCWIDIYYNLNFVNINKQLLSGEDEVDIAAVMGNIEKGWTWGEDTSEDNTSETAKVFSDLSTFRSSSFYIKSWKPVNRSSRVTFRYGSVIIPGIFEHLRDLYEDVQSKKYWAPEMTPIYDKDKTDNHIILRGRPTYDPETDQNSQARANYSIPDIYKNSPYMGIQYTINNPDEDNSQWTGNHHQNYKRAQVHNIINLAELNKLNVHISVRGKNMNVIKGDKMPILLRKKTPEEVRSVDQDTKEETEKNKEVDYFYSGWYLVKGFNIVYNNPTSKGDVSSESRFSQTFIMTRREWPAPVPVQKENV